MGCSGALGLDKAIAAAKSIQELGRITLDVDSAELAFGHSRCAPSRRVASVRSNVRGLKEGDLKLILKNRFADWKKTREREIPVCRQPD